MTKKYAVSIVVLAIASFFSSGVVAHAQVQATPAKAVITASSTIPCRTFNYNLGLDAKGREGSDLSVLRKILAEEGFSIANYDVVSVKISTTTPAYRQYIYGPATYFAVKDFQEKYGLEILAQFGLTKGTGFVGAATRTKLNRLYGCPVPKLPLPLLVPSVSPAPAATTLFPVRSGSSGGGSSVSAAAANSVSSGGGGGSPSNPAPTPPPAPSQSITVADSANSFSAPNASVISWESQNVTRVKIEACWSSASQCSIIADSVAVTASPQTYTWNVEANKPYVGKNDVVVKVSDLDSPVSSRQEHGISISLDPALAPSIEVTQPVNSFTIPTPIGVEWISKNVLTVKIEACWNGTHECALLASSVDAALGRYVWNAEDGQPYVGKSDVVVKVSDNNSSASDTSNSPIQINPPEPI